MSRARKPGVSFNSPVILSFTAICFVALLLGYVTKNTTTDLLFSVYRSSPLSLLTYVRLIGHVFGHAGWEHFIGNIMLLLVVGPLLEEKYGSYNILFVILATAVITGVVHCLLFPNVRLLGASGVVFAFILLASLTSIKTGSIPLTFILVAVIYMGQQVYEGIFLQDNVSNLTHIFGGIVGAGLGYVMNKKRMNRY
ncbi:MAG: rhomboid family intramembrane serine protease [Lachnospiraceae bacterium]|nr:rhomboid family intramembrane serine protease [Lachnospiraceae bacterium]